MTGFDGPPRTYDDCLPAHPTCGAALRHLRAYPFPGNVRDFERAVALAEDGRPLPPESLSERIRAAAAVQGPADARRGRRGAQAPRERRMIEDALRECGSKTRAAERLGLSRQSLQRTLRLRQS